MSCTTCYGQAVLRSTGCARCACLTGVGARLLHGWRDGCAPGWLQMAVMLVDVLRTASLTQSHHLLRFGIKAAAPCQSCFACCLCRCTHQNYVAAALHPRRRLRLMPVDGCSCGAAGQFPGLSCLGTVTCVACSSANGLYLSKQQLLSSGQAPLQDRLGNDSAALVPRYFQAESQSCDAAGCSLCKLAYWHVFRPPTAHLHTSPSLTTFLRKDGLRVQPQR
jgi:hypothetical protein